MKNAIATTITIYLTISASAAFASNYLDCVSTAYRNLQTKRLKAISATEIQLKHTNPALARVFHVQVEKWRTLQNLDLISYNYFVKTYPDEMEAYFQKKSLTLASLAPQWEFMINGKHNHTFNEMYRNKQFRKEYEYLTSLENKLEKVQDSDLFKKAGDIYYPLFIRRAKSEKLKEDAMLKIKELDCN